MKHQKHTKLVRPSYGTFGRNEWAIIGTPCGNIQRLAKEIVNALSSKWKIGWVDADHHSAEGLNADIEYTDKISHHRFDIKAKMDVFQYRPFFNNMDGVIVNGNHFQAKHQIVVIDPKKEESLSRKLDRLTDVQLVLLTEGMNEPYGFLSEYIPKGIPVFNLSETKKVVAFLANKLEASIPPVYGLVLVGGKSQRMGKDKGAIDYHGMPQREYAAGLLDDLCEKTFLSCRSEQADGLKDAGALILDTFTGLGPMGAILSAFREQPEVAWMVVACDLPLLDEKTLGFLRENRNASKIATTFRSPVNEFPEPLVTIWEPRSYPVLLQFLAQGYSCPRKALINSPVEVLEVPEAEALLNVNTPKELEAVFEKIK